MSISIFPIRICDTMPLGWPRSYSYHKFCTDDVVGGAVRYYPAASGCEGSSSSGIENVRLDAYCGVCVTDFTRCVIDSTALCNGLCIAAEDGNWTSLYHFTCNG